VSPPGSAVPHIARGFDRLAPFYDGMADLAFAGRIHASQTILLPRLPKVRRILVVGGGTGRFLSSFLRHDASALAVSIDASSGMTRKTEARLAREGFRDRVDLRIGGLENLGPNERFDLIATHCFLDLFEEDELEGVMATLGEALSPEGHWLFSDFALAAPNGRGVIRRSIIAMLYAFFRATSGIAASRLPNFDRAFGRIGFREVASAGLARGILRASLLRKPLPDRGR